MARKPYTGKNSPRNICLVFERGSTFPVTPIGEMEVDQFFMRELPKNMKGRHSGNQS